MKHFKLFRALILFVFIFNGVACSEQLDIDSEAILDMNEANIAGLTRGETPKAEYMPLNVIPDWAKQKMTDEEYALWTIIGSMYEVDYSFLQKELDAQQKEILYNEVRNICREIMSGEIKKPAGYFTVYNSSDDICNNIEQLTRSEMPNQGTFAIGPVTAFSVSDSEARVLVTAICVVKDSKIVSARDAKAYASGRGASSFNGSVAVSSISAYSVTVSCAGTLEYYTAASRYPFRANFNTSVRIVPFP